MILEQLNKFGFTEIINVNFKNNELISLQNIIYNKTKHLIIEHNNELALIKKIQLPFKNIPTKNDWSLIMNSINESIELKNLINSDEVKDYFKAIFDNPKIYKICTFRARFPDQKRVVYNWHQDEGTWYLSKNKELLNKFTATMWFSINGSNFNNSIQLIKYSHKSKLLNHSYVEGQGYFNASIDSKSIDEKNIHVIETKPSQAIIFHPLTLHRSAPSEKYDSKKPRYSIDIRYYDDAKKLSYSTDIVFKMKKLVVK